MEGRKALLCSLKGQIELGGQATKFLAGGSNGEDVLRVYDSNGDFLQLVYSQYGIRLDDNVGGTASTLWQAALKSDLTPTTPQTIRSQCRYSKSGNVVVVSCQGLQTEIPANTWTTLFTMPVGYKPNFSIHSTAAFASDGSKPGLVRVDTDGVCSVYSKELTTVSWFTVLFLAGG